MAYDAVWQMGEDFGGGLHTQDANLKVDAITLPRVAIDIITAHHPARQRPTSSQPAAGRTLIAISGRENSRGVQSTQSWLLPQGYRFQGQG